MCIKTPILDFDAIGSCDWPFEHWYDLQAIILGPWVRELIVELYAWFEDLDLWVCILKPRLRSLGTCVPFWYEFFDLGIYWNPNSLGWGSWPTCHASSIIKFSLCMRIIHLTYMSTCLGFHLIQCLVQVSIHMHFTWTFLIHCL